MPPAKKRTGGNRNQPIVSCLECRRMKWKCDRQFPCAHCRRRGMAHMCPDGHLRPVRDAPALHDETQAMRARIAELEAQVGAMGETLERHGLSAAEHARPSKPPPQLQDHVQSPKPSYPGEVIAEDGQLTLGDEPGSSFFFGGAGSHFLWSSVQTQSNPHPPSGGSHGPPLREMLDKLPERAHGERWVRMYFKTGSIKDDIVKHYWVDEVLEAAYAGIELDSQVVSILYAVMAHGASLDTDLPPHNEESDRLFYLARGALELNAEGSKEYIQAVQLIGRFVGNSRRPELYSGFWTKLGTAVRCALQLGLHRDPAKFGIEATEAETRRRVFWEINHEDTMQSLVTGRPRMIMDTMVDTEYPGDDAREDDPWFNLWNRYKYRVLRIIGRISNIMNTLEPVPYSEIMDVHWALLELEKEIPRELTVAEHARVSPWRQFYLRIMINEGYLFLHRWGFKRCLLDSRAEPFLGHFRFSYVMELVTSETILNILRDSLALDCKTANRLWIFWFHAFTSFINLVSVVIRSPLSSLALDALAQVDRAVKLFEDSGPGFGQQLLPMIQRMARRAQNAFVLLDAGEEGEDDRLLGVGHNLVRCTKAEARSDQSPELPDTLEAAGVAVADFSDPSGLPQIQSPLGRTQEDFDLNTLLTDSDSFDWDAVLRDDFAATLVDHGLNLAEM